MQEINQIVIQGAGALGAFYAARFHDAGFAVRLLARGERYERLKQDGLVVNGRSYALPVVHPEEKVQPADLVLVALKHRHLETAVPDLHNLVGPNTTLISVMNGLDSEEIFGARYGLARVLYTVVVGIDAVRQGNRVTATVPGMIFIGEARNDTLSPRLRTVQVALERAELPYETPADMIRKLWWKLMVNVGVNQASAAMQAPYGAFQRSPDAQALMEALMHELVALAACAGVDLTEQDIEDWYNFLNTLSPDGKTSMLQDIDAGRPTEVDIFAGKVVELGRQYNVPTPVNETVLHIIRILGKRGQRWEGPLRRRG